MLQEAAKPTTTLRCHPKWFQREVRDKGRHFNLLGDGRRVVRDWPQSVILLDDRLPPEGFYAV